MRTILLLTFILHLKRNFLLTFLDFLLTFHLTFNQYLAIINFKGIRFRLWDMFPQYMAHFGTKIENSEIISQIQRIKKRVIFHYRFRRFSTNKEFFIKKRIDTRPDHFSNFCKYSAKSGLSRHKKIPTAKGRY